MPMFTRDGTQADMGYLEERALDLPEDSRGDCVIGWSELAQQKLAAGMPPHQVAAALEAEIEDDVRRENGSGRHPVDIEIE